MRHAHNENNGRNRTVKRVNNQNALNEGRFVAYIIKQTTTKVKERKNASDERDIFTKPNLTAKNSLNSRH